MQKKLGNTLAKMVAILPYEGCFRTTVIVFIRLQGKGTTKNNITKEHGWCQNKGKL